VIPHEGAVGGVRRTRTDQIHCRRTGADANTDRVRGAGTHAREIAAAVQDEAPVKRDDPGVLIDFNESKRGRRRRAEGDEHGGRAWGRCRLRSGIKQVAGMRKLRFPPSSFTRECPAGV